MTATLHSSESVRGPRVRFPRWIDGADPEETRIQRWSFDETTTILRQSVRTHFEAPFIYLIEGRGRALLLDSGTGDVNVREEVDRLLAGKDLDLVVAHTHDHFDHVGGDRFFAGRQRTRVIAHDPESVLRFFEIEDEARAGGIDLGGRVVDVLYIPGHQAAHVAFYDRTTEILFTGDTLFPGRLTVDDWPRFHASVKRLTRFVSDGRPASYVLGSHIEMDSAEREYALAASVHPDEHSLELSEADLHSLSSAVELMDPLAPPEGRVPLGKFTIVLKPA